MGFSKHLCCKFFLSITIGKEKIKPVKATIKAELVGGLNL